MIATARAGRISPLVHGVDARRPVDAATVTRHWARSVLRDQRATVAALLRMGERLRDAEAGSVASLPDESDRECRCLCQRGLFDERTTAAAPPALPSGPAPHEGAADPASIPAELVPWLRPGRKGEASLFATVCRQKGRGHWFVVVPLYTRGPGEPSRFGVFKTELEAVRAAMARFGPEPPVPPAKRTRGGKGHTPNLPAESDATRSRKAVAREWMLRRREWLNLPEIVR